MDRFNEKWVEDNESGCWEWTARINTNGYGQIFRDGRMYQAHRFSYEMHIGPIPERPDYHGTQVNHRCDNRKCVNPDHLMLGTAQSNMDDKVSKNRQTKGEEHSQTDLTDEQIREIRKLYEPRVPGCGKRTYTLSVLADIYGVSLQMISRIIRNEWWKHVQ